MTIGKDRQGRTVEVSWKVVAGFLLSIMGSALIIGGSGIWQLSKIHTSITESAVAIKEIQGEIRGLIIKAVKIEEPERRVSRLESKHE